MLSNLTGWHALIIVGVLGAMALVAAAIVLLFVRLDRGPRSGGSADRLAQLDQMRAQGLVTEAEYAAKRQEIIGRL